MSVPFDPTGRSVLAPVWVAGLDGIRRFEFRVDTGANRTVMRPTLLARLGYEVGPSSRHLRMRSATGQGIGRPVVVSHLIALGRKRDAFELVAQELPPAVTTDGLLGLDFFRGRILTLDFVRGGISLDPPRKWWRPWG